MRCNARHDFPSLKVAACALPLTALWLLTALPVLAQHQVNTMARTSVNTAVYGGTSSGSVRYAGVNPSIASRTSTPMQSEVRYEYLKSGMTPSEYRMGSAALGPMANGGPMSYVNYKPTYLSSKDKPAPPVPQMSASDAARVGSVRYSQPRSQASTSASLKALDAMIKPASPAVATPKPSLSVTSSMNSMGSIKYAR